MELEDFDFEAEVRLKGELRKESMASLSIDPRNTQSMAVNSELDDDCVPTI